MSYKIFDVSDWNHRIYLRADGDSLRVYCAVCHVAAAVMVKGPVADQMWLLTCPKCTTVLVEPRSEWVPDKLKFNDDLIQKFQMQYSFYTAMWLDIEQDDVQVEIEEEEPLG